MDILSGIFFFIFGTIIGSFLNVVILRFNTNSSILGRSMCFMCGKKLEWYELIPIFSYILLKGKCFFCKSKIAIQYPLVELFTGLMFLWVYLKGFSDLYTIISLIVISTLIVIFVYDLNHKIIPNGPVYTFILIAFVQLFINFKSLTFQTPNTLDLLAGPILFFPFFILWFISKGKWMGFGDGKLVLGIGWMLGLIDGFSAIIFAFWAGAIISVLLILLSKILHKSYLTYKLKSLNIKSEIPFAPFLIIGFVFVFFLEFNIIDFIS